MMETFSLFTAAIIFIVGTVVMMAFAEGIRRWFL